MATKATTLFSLATVKAYIPVESANTKHDTTLEKCADGVSEKIESWTGRKFVTRTLTEYYEGRDTPTLQLRTFPVISITTLKVRLTMNDTYVLVPSTDYDTDKRLGIIYLKNVVPGLVVDAFPSQPLAVEVVYSAGYGAQDNAALPQDIYQAGLDYVKFLYQRWQTGLVFATSQNLSNMSIAISPKPPADMVEVINFYRRVRL